jgi:hypothetical protein
VSTPFLIEPLSKTHKRSDFSCGNDRIDSCFPVLIGWLGRHSDSAGMGLGEILRFDAVKTVAFAPIGAGAIFADVIDDKAVSLTLYLPIATALIRLSEQQGSGKRCNMKAAP